jgi:hypothetical protein
MRKLLVLSLLLTTGCATMRRHPAVTGMVAGVAIGGTIAILTRHTCPHTINGYPYDGTWPCPNPKTYDPGGRK